MKCSRIRRPNYFINLQSNRLILLKSVSSRTKPPNSMPFWRTSGRAHFLGSTCHSRLHTRPLPDEKILSQKCNVIQQLNLGPDHWWRRPRRSKVHHLLLSKVMQNPKQVTQIFFQPNLWIWLAYLLIENISLKKSCLTLSLLMYFLHYVAFWKYLCWFA